MMALSFQGSRWAPSSGYPLVAWVPGINEAPVRVSSSRRATGQMKRPRAKAWTPIESRAKFSSAALMSSLAGGKSPA